jgi:DNA primase
VLYALDQAWDDVRRQRAVVIVEGYMDAIAAHQFGFANVVASMGTAVTPNQVRGIRRYVERVFLALDADAAGQLAALRGIEALRDGFSDEERPAIMPRGPVRFERTIGAEIRVVVLPHGKDPDELIRADRAAWAGALDGAVPLVEYFLTHALADIERTPAARARALQEIAVPVLREIGDAAVLAQYVGLTGRLLGYKDADVHGAILRGAAVRPQAAHSPTVRPDERPSALDPERYLLALMLRYPHIALGYLDQLHEDDVLDARHREILKAIGTAEGVLEAVLDALPEELREYALSLAGELVNRPEMTPGASSRELGQATQRLGLIRHEFRVRQVRDQVETARRAGDPESVAENLRRMAVLASRKPTFDPLESPYFRDSRSEVR